jgi:hypothetical protein
MWIIGHLYQVGACCVKTRPPGIRVIGNVGGTVRADAAWISRAGGG